MSDLTQELPATGLVRVAALVNTPAITEEQIAKFKTKRNGGEGYPKVPRPATRGILNLSRSWLEQQVGKGLFPAPVRVGGTIAFRVEDIREWLSDPELWVTNHAGAPARPKLAAVRAGQSEHAHA